MGQEVKRTRCSWCIEGANSPTVAHTKAKRYLAFGEARLSTIRKVDLTSDLFTYKIDDKALKKAKLADGKLVLITNIDAKDRDAEEIIKRYTCRAGLRRCTNYFHSVFVHTQ